MANSWQKTGKGDSRSAGLPFNLVRFFSWVSLALVLGSSFFLSLFIGNTMVTTLIDSQEEYALLTVENLNRQIFRKFALPASYAFGRVALADPVQYKLLDDVVQSLLHGLRIERIRIYDGDYVVTYSTDGTEVRRDDLYTPGIPLIFRGNAHHFDVLSTMSYLRAFLTPNLDEGAFQLRTIYPLSIDPDLNRFGPDPEESTVLGALEVIQDITSHYKMAIRSQRLIVVGFLLSSLVLFILLQMMARQAERILGERMSHNRRLEADLHQNEKLASIGRMVATIAHEIRNPLGIIRSSAEFLIRRGKTEDKTTRDILTAIYDESCRLGATGNDFLDYARPRQLRTGDVNLAQTLNKVTAFLDSEFTRHRVRIHCAVPESLRLSGDPDMLYRAMYNILVNALQAIGEDGRIYIEGSRLSEQEKVMMTFRDTGPGFTDLAKALDPFFTTKDSGTGLGLPIVQSIVAAHGGVLRLENAPGGGALISLVFPFA